jgi:hypothetical protein
MKDNLKDRNILRYFLVREKNNYFKFFSTFTFGEDSRLWDEIKKVEEFKNFLQKLKRKKAFEYFWVSEKDYGEHMHFHLITTWDFSYNYIRERWNEFLKIELNSPSVTISLMDESDTSYENRINYLFKDSMNNFSFSMELKKDYIIFVKLLFYKDFQILLTNKQFSDKINLHNTKEGTIEDEHRYENNIIDLYNEKEMNPNLVSWIQKLNLILTIERTEFFSKLRNAREKRLIWYKSFLNDEDWINLWKGLIFFYIANGLKGREMLHHDFYRHLKTLLFFVKEKKINWENYVQFDELDIDNEIWYNLVLIIEYYFKLSMKDYLDIEENDYEDEIYRKIVFKKKFNEIEWGGDLGFTNYKGKMPMVVKPLDWNLEGKGGGYLYNNKYFTFLLTKTNFSSKLLIQSQRAIDSINYLQHRAYKINFYLLSFLNINKELIKIKLFPGYENDKKTLYNKIEKVKIKIKFLYKNKPLDNYKIASLYKEKNELIGLVNEIEKFDKILEVANELSVYNVIYFMVQLDFRGRINPISDFLNYQGDNLAKALIYLNKESKINMYWFKIYCLKKYGYNLVGKNVENMHKLFNDELSNLMLNYKENFCWLKAEDKFEFLNCCLEYEKYLIFGEQYKTSMPIYFDATCSGSQLITLLLGIDDFVKDLNLSATTQMDELHDYYLRIVNDYKIYLLSYLNNREVFKKELNNILKTDMEWRKFFKHIIMTLNYGLTGGGMMLKLLKKNKELNLNFSLDLLKIIYYTFSEYLSNISLVKSLNTFSDLVKEVAELNKDIFIYTTYAGFVKDQEKADYIFTQGYRKWNKKTVVFDKKKVNTSFEEKITDKELRKRFRKKYTFINVDYNKVDKKKQALAFKANIIHHLDAMWIHASLQKLSKIENFGSICVVHDCFGVGFDDIVTLNKVVRECLIDFFKTNNLYLLLYNLERSKHNKDFKLNKKDEQKILDLLKNKHIVLNDNMKMLEDLEFAYYLIFPG